MGDQEYPILNQSNGEEFHVDSSVILDWIPKQIRIRKLSNELINALSDDTHEISIYIENKYSDSQKIINKQKTFNWNLNRRFLYIFMDVIGHDRKVLANAFQIEKARRNNCNDENWYRPIGKQKNISAKKSGFYNHKCEKMINLNLKSLVTLIGHKKTLEKWWIEGDLGDGASPVKHVTEYYNKMKQEEGGGKNWRPSARGKRSWKNNFTRKFNVHISDCINAYWYRVKHIEAKSHGKRTIKPRKYAVGRYRKYILSLILLEWAEYNHEKCKKNINLNPKLKKEVRKEFPNSVDFFKDAAKYLQYWDVNIGYKSDDFKHLYEGVPDKCSNYGCSGVVLEDFKHSEYYCYDCGLVYGYIPKTENEKSEETKMQEGTTSDKKNREKQLNIKKLERQLDRRPSWHKKIIKIRDEIKFLLEFPLAFSEKESIEESINKRILAIARFKTLN